jgi:hypothetical protein
MAEARSSMGRTGVGIKMDPGSTEGAHLCGDIEWPG